jgi:hypothetical protein
VNGSEVAARLEWANAAEEAIVLAAARAAIAQGIDKGVMERAVRTALPARPVDMASSGGWKGR